MDELFLVGAVSGLTEVAKTIGLPSRFAPLVAIVFGVLAASLSGFSGETTLQGIKLGLLSVGLWSSTRAITGN